MAAGLPQGGENTNLPSASCACNDATAACDVMHNFNFNPVTFSSGFWADRPDNGETFMASSVQVESRNLLRQLSHQSSEGSER